MKDFIIMTDSGCDLTKEMATQCNVDIVPMGLTVDDKTYKHYHDFREISASAFYAALSGGSMSKTAAANVADIVSAMKNYAKKGIDVLYLSLSSGISSSYQAAMLAAEQVKEEFPNAVIRVVDTFSASAGQGMLTYLATKQKALQKDINQVTEYIVNTCKQMRHHFIVDDLKFVQRGGRLTAAEAFVGSMLGIKPLMRLADNGTVAVAGKARGRKAALRYLVENATEHCSDSGIFFVNHANAEAEAQSVIEQIKAKFPNAETHLGWIGPIIGSHGGPGALVVAFLGNAR